MKFGEGFSIWRQLFMLVAFLFAADNATAQLITVRPGQLDHYTVSAPAEATAGEDFFLQIKAHDNKGNIITNYSDVGKSIKLLSSGSQQLAPKTLSATSFIGGVATVKAVYYKAETIVITVKDSSDQSTGASGPVTVKPNTIHHFTVQAPSSVRAGEEFVAKVMALDAYENVIGNYNSLGKGVNVSTSGTSKISPNFIPSSNFVGGVASVRFNYSKAENITVNLSEKDRPDISKSNRVVVEPNVLERFVVTTEGSAVAGMAFTLKIKAVDAYDNVINNFNTLGKDVKISSTGSGELVPNVVSASSFVDGLATVDVRYDKAESFSINVFTEGVQVPVRKEAQLPVTPAKRVETAPPVQPVQPVPAPKAEAPAPEPAKDDFSDMLILQ